MNSSVGAGTEFTCITAAVLGGVSMAGGEGKVWKVRIGAIILGVLSNGMQFIGLGVYPQYVAKGVILMAAISFDTYQKNARTEEEKTEEKQVETQDAA
jgi:ribose/xylose/arabinose/galactoside ABC-type transport system permease subunit